MQTADLATLSTVELITTGRRIIARSLFVDRKALTAALRRQAGRHDANSGSRRKAA
jgi:hypothetical protein